MTAIVLNKAAPPPAATGKSGDNGYDRCPTDACSEVDFSFKNGGTDARGAGHYSWFTYYADPRNGGCGTNWARTTKQGVVKDQSRGINPKWRTASAQADRYTSVPSERYMNEYQRIFGHD